DARVPDRVRLVDAGEADAEDRILRPLVGAVQPAAFLGSDDVEVDEAGKLRIALRRDAAGAAREAGACGVVDRRIALIHAAAEADLLVQPPSAQLNASLAQSRKRVVPEAEFVASVHVGG